MWYVGVMAAPSRRAFLRRSTLGLAAVGVAGLSLRADAQPTPQARSDHDLPPDAAPTEPNILGPFYRRGAPFRGKVTPPLAAGTALLIDGRVWSFGTRRPLAGAVLDVWQAGHDGRYDNDDPRSPPKPGVFTNRCRVAADEAGRYEFETVHPGRYLNGRRLRPAHVHYRVTAPGHRELVTQLYFEGDPHLDGDPFARPSLVVPLRTTEANGGTYEAATFDVVLAAD